MNAYKTKIGGHRQFLHPCAEPLNNALVLQADLTFKSNLIIVNYKIDDAGLLSKSERDQIERHHARLQLGVRYSRRAHSYLASFRASIAGKPPAAVARTLQEKVNTSAVGEPINGWRPALYRAIADERANVLTWLVNP